jgi:hypothetical protein
MPTLRRLCRAEPKAFARSRNAMISKGFFCCGKMRQSPENPEPNVKQTLLGLFCWKSGGDFAWR